jgi:hypothetical protein
MLLCRRLGQSLGKFYRHVAVAPMLHCLPFFACLVAGRLLFKAYPVPAMAVCAVGCVTLAVFYWRSVLPGSLKNGLRRRYEKIGRRAGVSGAGVAAK